MKDIFKNLGKFALEILKELDWKSVLYKAYKTVVDKKLQEYVNNTESKWDDVMKAGVDRIIDAFLKPDEVKEEA